MFNKVFLFLFCDKSDLIKNNSVACLLSIFISRLSIYYLLLIIYLIIYFKIIEFIIKCKFMSEMVISKDFMNS